MNLSDHFLLAMPGQIGGPFGGSIVYVCQHNPDGAFGLVVNKLSELSLSALCDELKLPAPEYDAQLHDGGPVDPGRGFILHSPERRYEGSIDVSDAVVLSASSDALVDIGSGDGPSQVLMTLGYAGWGPGQLDAELQTDAWLTCPGDPAVLFNTPIEQRVQRAADSLGVDFRLISPQSGNA